MIIVKRCQFQLLSLKVPVIYEKLKVKFVILSGAAWTSWIFNYLLCFEMLTKNDCSMSCIHCVGNYFVYKTLHVRQIAVI